jgi:hypothetical protein
LFGLAVILIPFYCCGAVLVAVLLRGKAIEPAVPSVAPSEMPRVTPTESTDTAQTVTAVALALSATSTVVLLPTPTQLVLNSSPYDPSNTNTTPSGIVIVATDISGVPTPVGMIPDCADFNGSTNQAIRANVPSGSAGSAHIYCRVITDKYQIGVASVLARGVQIAVDVFALNGGSSVIRFNNPIYVCLQGSGVFIFLDANQSPRTPTQLISVADSGYQCANRHYPE